MAVDPNMKFLIVDDYNTMLRILRNLLKQLNFMTGIQLLREVRADPESKRLPFIMITAESKSENVIAAKEAGVSNYIVKPFNAETLKSKLVSVLGEF